MYDFLLWNFNEDETQLGSWDIVNHCSGVGAESLYQALKARPLTTFVITHHPQLLRHSLSPFGTLKGDLDIKFNKRKIRFLDIKALTAKSEFDIPACEAVFETWRNETEDIKHASELPITAVQVLRQRVKTAMKRGKCKRYRYLLNSDFDQEAWYMYHQAKQGGIMFVNPKFKGVLLRNVVDYDKHSAYTAACLTRLFPKNLGIQVKPVKENLSKFNTLSTIRLRDVQCVKLFPYIYEKASRVIGRAPILENNRIVECDYVELTVTPMDWERIKETYTFNEVEVIKQRVFKMDYLPRALGEIIQEITEKDISLKGVPGKEDERALNKIMKNSITGMMGELKEEEDISKDRYVNPFWYIWLTSYLRSELHKIACDHPDTTVYVNTDGIALTEQDDEYFDALDKEARLEMAAACYDFPKNIPGTWDCEVYKEYKTLGVNKEWRDGELKLGGYLIEQSRELLETIEDFTEDFQGVRPNIYRRIEGGKFKKVSKEYADMISVIESCSKLTCA